MDPIPPTTLSPEQHAAAVAEARAQIEASNAASTRALRVSNWALCGVLGATLITGIVRGFMNRNNQAANTTQA